MMSSRSSDVYSGISYEMKTNGESTYTSFKVNDLTIAVISQKENTSILITQIETGSYAIA